MKTKNDLLLYTRVKMERVRYFAAKNVHEKCKFR